MSLAIKKKFPNFYRFSKNITNHIPMKGFLWNNKSYNFNYRIYKMIKTWNQGALKEEADFVYKYYDGGDFVDVGSWAGFYSFLLSPKAKHENHFVSCEPDHSIHHEILENLSILKKNFSKINYSLISLPVANGKEVVTYHDVWGHPCFLESDQIEDINVKSKKKFNSITVDNIVSSLSLKPTFIKIDTEGAEFDVLKGMKQTLVNFKPKIMLEKHPTMIPKNITLEIINNFLKENGYKAELIDKSDIAIREIWK
jgi:FkbM family methyltransferase